MGPKKRIPTTNYLPQNVIPPDIGAAKGDHLDDVQPPPCWTAIDNGERMENDKFLRFNNSRSATTTIKALDITLPLLVDPRPAPALWGFIAPNILAGNGLNIIKSIAAVTAFNKGNLEPYWLGHWCPREHIRWPIRVGVWVLGFGFWILDFGLIMVK